jgi:hypothetical protein
MGKGKIDRRNCRKKQCAPLNTPRETPGDWYSLMLSMLKNQAWLHVVLL